MRRVRRASMQTVAIVFALADQSTGWCHGYDLCRRLEFKAGTVYPILMRLAERGQLETMWETNPPPGRPPRHLYRLSKAGLEFANELRELARAEVQQDRSATSSRPALGEAF